MVGTQAFALMIEEDYRVNLLLDNLPIAMPVYIHESDENEPSTNTKTVRTYSHIFHMQVMQ